MSIILCSVVALLCFSCWPIAELEGSRRLVRMGIGGLAMVAVAGLSHVFAKFTPGIESGNMRSSLRLAEQLMTAGDPSRVRQAIHAYNEKAASATTYKASFDLWNMLNHGPQVVGGVQPGQTPQLTVRAGSQQ